MAKTSTKRVKDEDITEVVNETVEEAKVSEDVSTEAPLTEPTVDPEVIKGRVANCKKLNIRTKPSKGSEVACVALAGDELIIKNPSIKNAKWYPVTTKDGMDGYCMAEYLKF